MPPVLRFPVSRFFILTSLLLLASGPLAWGSVNLKKAGGLAQNPVDVVTSDQNPAEGSALSIAQIALRERPVNYTDPTGLLGLAPYGYSLSNPNDPRWIPTGYFKEDYSNVKTASVKYHLGADSQQFSKAGKNTTEGAPVLSRTDGKVVQTGTSKATGKFVRVEGADGGRTDYFHLSEIGVEVDQEVGVGKTLGAAGSTGPDGTSSHLHVAQSYPGNGGPSGDSVSYGDRRYVAPPSMNEIAAANNPQSSGTSGGGLIGLILSWFSGGNDEE